MSTRCRYTRLISINCADGGLTNRNSNVPCKSLAIIYNEGLAVILYIHSRRFLKVCVSKDISPSYSLLTDFANFPESSSSPIQWPAVSIRKPRDQHHKALNKAHTNSGHQYQAFHSSKILMIMRVYISIYQGIYR